MNRQSDKFYSEILSHVSRSVANDGFVRRGTTLRCLGESSVALIEFQRSDKSSADVVIFTVNLGIALKRLLDVSPSKVSMTNAHLRTRLGMVLPEREDKWWTVSRESDVPVVSSKIEVDLKEAGIPYLLAMSSEAALLELWGRGLSPGLTGVQRCRLLNELRKLPDATA